MAGTITVTRKSQNAALYSSAATIINRVAKQVGKTAITDPYGSTDPDFLLLCDLLTSVGDDLLKAHDWRHLVNEASFVTDGSTSSWQLPDDYTSYLDQSGWNRTTRYPLVGPLSVQQEQSIKAWLANAIVYITFQLEGGYLTSPVVPGTGATVAFVYETSYFGMAAAGTAADRVPSALGDLVLFDDELVIAGLKLRYAEERGYDTTKLQERYDEKLESAKGNDMGGAVLSLGGGRNLGVNRMIDGQNIPIGNWGQ